jgi:serine protease
MKRLLLTATLLALVVGASDRHRVDPFADPPIVQRAGVVAAALRPTAASRTSGVSSRTTWGLRAVGAPDIWRWGSGSPATVVAVLDTGVDGSSHEFSVRPGWNVLTNSADTRDDNGHGTLVAGVIAGRSRGRSGVSGYCRRCTILPVKVLDHTGQGSGANIAAGIVWAVDHAARVVNLSFVLSTADPAVTDAIGYANDHGVAVVAATGNSGGTAPRYPAADPGVISIAAASPTGPIYRWSGTGSWVTAAAPGCNATTGLGGRTVDFCGTSSAAAAASGMIGLALSDAPGVAVAALRPAFATNRPAPSLIDGVALLRLARASAPG